MKEGFLGRIIDAPFNAAGRASMSVVHSIWPEKVTQQPFTPKDEKYLKLFHADPTLRRMIKTRNLSTSLEEREILMKQIQTRKTELNPAARFS